MLARRWWHWNPQTLLWDSSMVSHLENSLTVSLVNPNMVCLLLFLVYTHFCLYLSLTIKKYEARKTQSLFEDSLYLLSYSNLLIKVLTSINPSCIMELILPGSDYLVQTNTEMSSSLTFHCPCVQVLCSSQVSAQGHCLVHANHMGGSQ